MGGAVCLPIAASVSHWPKDREGTHIIPSLGMPRASGDTGPKETVHKVASAGSNCRFIHIHTYCVHIYILTEYVHNPAHIWHVLAEYIKRSSIGQALILNW